MVIYADKEPKEKRRCKLPALTQGSTPPTAPHPEPPKDWIGCLNFHAGANLIVLEKNG